MDIAQSPFDNDLIGDLKTKKPPALPIVPGGGSQKNLFAADDAGGQVSNQGNIRMNLGLHNKKFANQRAKKNLVNMGIPALDFTSLKHVKDFKDWYGYS